MKKTFKWHAKPMKAWAIAHWDKGFYVDTVSATRRDALEKFEQLYGEAAAASGIAPNKAVKIEIQRTH